MDGSVRVLHLPGEEMSLACIMEPWLLSFMWMLLWWVPHHTFLNISADQVERFKTSVFPNVSGLFVQDDTSCHTAKIVPEWTEIYNKEVGIIFIKHLWDVLWKTSPNHTSPTSQLKDDLKNLPLLSWCQIPQCNFRGLVESLPRHVRAVLAALFLWHLHNIRQLVLMSGLLVIVGKLQWNGWPDELVTKS